MEWTILYICWKKFSKSFNLLVTFFWVYFSHPITVFFLRFNQMAIPVFFMCFCNSLFYTYIPIKILRFFYSYVFSILRFKGALNSRHGKNRGTEKRKILIWMQMENRGLQNKWIAVWLLQEKQRNWMREINSKENFKRSELLLNFLQKLCRVVHFIGISKYRIWFNHILKGNKSREIPAPFSEQVRVPGTFHGYRVFFSGYEIGFGNVVSDGYGLSGKKFRYYPNNYTDITRIMFYVFVRHFLVPCISNTMMYCTLYLIPKFLMI